MKAVMVRALLIVSVTLTSPLPAFAEWSMGGSVGETRRHHHDRHQRYYRDRDRHFYRWHDRPQYGYRMRSIPAGHFTVWSGGRRYYYYDGLYYTREGLDYVLIEPPMGVHVSAIPSAFRPVVINGTTYYTDNGMYYILTRHGYQLVPAPVVYAPPPVVVASPVVTTPRESYFTLNVPNNNGSYTSVTITRSADGYVGPQGEFYSQFPSVAQLKEMYGQ